jgi:hypothetical protein
MASLDCVYVHSSKTPHINIPHRFKPHVKHRSSNTTRIHDHGHHQGVGGDSNIQRR